MSDDEADPELLELLRQSLGIGSAVNRSSTDTGILKDSEYICDNSIDVAISASGCKQAASSIWRTMQAKQYSTNNWSEHELHPKPKDETTVDFIFTTNLLNFSFWSELSPGEAFAVEYKTRNWTGYWSLVAALQRALEEGIPITSSDFWQDRGECTDEVLRYVFRSATSEAMPLLPERIQMLREAGFILYQSFGCTFTKCIEQANHSATALVNLVVDKFSSFEDQFTFHGKRVKLFKRAQILVADLWACFDGQSWGRFDDIDKLTMFADYRIPQMLRFLGALTYSPPLEGRIGRGETIGSGENCEIEIRGCSIWCVELIRRQIIRDHSEAKGKLNAVLIDFFLYDTCKELEEDSNDKHLLPHHRTRSIWY